jgi:hypothetical protein
MSEVPFLNSMELAERLIVTHLVKEFLANISLPFSEEPTTDAYPEADESSPCPKILYFLDTF